MGETSTELQVNKRKDLFEVSKFIHIASKFTFWESECLVKALAARFMLNRRGIESTLYLGTGKDDTGKLIAHAWLRSGPYYITGFEEMKKFTVVATFANHVLPLRSQFNGN